MVRGLSSNKNFRRAGVPAAVAVALLLVAGCGGAGNAGPEPVPTASSASSSPAGAVVDLTGKEYSFAPSTLEVSAGRTTFRFTNQGAADHDFRIDALHIHLDAQPGETAEATVTLKPGTYESYCSVPGHRQSGMHGTVTVS